MSSETIDPMYDYSDPKRIGRGVWFMFMMMSMNCDTQEQRKFLCIMIRKCCDNFKCSKCQVHFRKYLESHPPEKESHSNDSLFRWVVTFMSAVNVRIGKPAYDYGKLYEIFDNASYGVCKANCGSEEIQAEEIEDVIPGLFVRSGAPRVSSRAPPRRR